MSFRPVAPISGQKWGIGNLARRDLDHADVQFVDQQAQALRIEGGRQELDSLCPAVAEDRPVIRRIEFEPAHHVELGLELACGTSLVLRLGRAGGDDAGSPERLELDRVGARPRGLVDELHRHRQGAVVVDARLGNDEHGSRHG